MQPMLALSLALKARGHAVLLAGPPERSPWAKSLGCPYAALGRDVMAFVDSGRSTRSPTAARAFHRFLREEIRHQFRVLPELIAGADLVVGASLSFGLSSVAETLNIPYRFIAFTPQLLPSGHHPCPVFKFQRLPPLLNRIGWRLAMVADRLNTTPVINEFRRSTGLKPVKTTNDSFLGERVIVASDAALAPIPRDISPEAVQTGYMHLRQPALDLPGLERFLSEGPAPVYVGFGSMPRVDQTALVPRVVTAARLAGLRVVVGLPRDFLPGHIAGKDVFFAPDYPHGALFPGMSAVVHHGGAGTTATAAASGVPQMIIPHILDQYFWGERVHRAGIGPRPPGRHRQKTEKLSRMIHDCVSSDRIKLRAQAVRDNILEKDGLEMTAEELLKGCE
jgi:UDP:flavonoid glycosyltransferase YjiC (YdhE family)